MTVIDRLKDHNIETLAPALYAAAPEWIATSPGGTPYSIMIPFLDGKRIRLEWPDTLPTSVAAINAIIDAHDPSVLSPEQERIQQATQQCRSFYRMTNTTWGTLTAAQKSDAVRDTLRALIYMLARTET